MPNATGLRQIREQLGVTQEAVARKTRLGLRTYIRAEGGNRVTYTLGVSEKKSSKSAKARVGWSLWTLNQQHKLWKPTLAAKRARKPGTVWSRSVARRKARGSLPETLSITWRMVCIQRRQRGDGSATGFRFWGESRLPPESRGASGTAMARWHIRDQPRTLGKRVHHEKGEQKDAGAGPKRVPPNGYRERWQGRSQSPSGSRREESPAGHANAWRN